MKGQTFDKMRVLERIQKLAAEAVAASAVSLQERIQDKLNQHNSSLTAGLTASTPGQPPANRTGALMRSIQAVNITINPSKPTWMVGTKLIYARIHEYGGRIRPTKSKYLAVPIGAEGYRAARDAQGKGLRALNLKVLRANGKLFLYRPGDPHAHKKNRRTDHLLFRLVKSVFLPARPYFRPAIAEHRESLSREFKKRGLAL